MWRVAGIRMLDTILTILVLWFLLGWAMHSRGKAPLSPQLAGKSFVLAVLLTFPLAIAGHLLFNRATHLNCLLGLVDPAKCAALKV